MLRNLPFALATAVLLGLAPFSPEPHIVGKVRWVLGGAEGMAAADWFDLVMHGAPWVWLALALILRLPMFNRGLMAAVGEALSTGGVVVDVRSPAEFQSGSVAGAKSVPVDTLPSGIEKLTQGDHAKPLLVFCRSGARSGRAAAILKAQGYAHVHNLGGLGRARQILGSIGSSGN